MSARPLFTPPLLLEVMPRRDGGRSLVSPSAVVSSFSDGIVVVLRNGLPPGPGLDGAVPPPAKLPTRFIALPAPARGGEFVRLRALKPPREPAVAGPRDSTKLLDCDFCSFKKSRLFTRVGEFFPGFNALSIAAFLKKEWVI